MAKQNAKSATNDIQTLFDPKGYQDAAKTFATMNERLTSIAVEAPADCLTGSGDVIGAWTTASLPQAAILNLLVPAHVLEPLRERHRRWPDRQTRRLQPLTECRNLGVLEPAALHGQPGGHEHARGHRLAMQPAAVAHSGLDRVAEGMAEIQ